MTTTYDVVRMAPELASTWLARPWHRQRRVSLPAIERYADAMREGRWIEPSLDPIALTEDGFLLNGQHRLLAVISASWKGDMLVARGVDPAMFPVIDTGRRRLAGQFVQSSQGDKVIAVARMALWYEERWPSHPRGRALTFDNDRLLGFVDDHAEAILQAVRDSSPTYKGGLPGKTSAALAYLARVQDADEERLERWIDGVTRGVNLEEDDPRLVLRTRLAGAGSVVVKRDGAALWALSVRSFNAYYQGRRITRLIFDPKGTPPVIDLSGKDERRATISIAKGRPVNPTIKRSNGATAPTLWPVAAGDAEPAAQPPQPPQPWR